MFYLISKFHDNHVNTFGFMEGGGGGLLKPQELQKSPGGIGLKEIFITNFYLTSRLVDYNILI